MPILHRDYETRSTLDLRKVGAWRYAAHPGTSVLCCAYAADDGPVKLWALGDPVPTEFLEAAQNPAWLVSAFNDNFERQIEAHIMSPRYSWPLIPIERHRCTQASALALALPASLDAVATALGLAEQKDRAGHLNMLALSKPRKSRKGEDPAGVYWHDDPARLERLYAYCRQDVETERALHARIGHLGPKEQAIWELDAAVNDRGVYVDGRLAGAAIQIGISARDEINAKLQALTLGEVATIDQTEKLGAWLSAHDCEVKDVQKETLRRALTRKDIPPEARRVMELRRDGAHASANKFQTMLNWRNGDGRIRGAFKYHGASTGRWTSLGVQLQNLKRPAVEDLQSAIDAVAAGNLAQLKTVYPQPMSVTGDIARATLCAAPGHRLIIADFSGIESRVLAWLSGQQSKLDQWTKFDQTGDPQDEPYLILGRSFGIAEDQARDKGKTGDLAFGFMGSVGAYRKFAPDDPATDAEIKRYQTAWRNAHPETVRFWGALNRAAIMAVRQPGKIFEVNSRVSFKCDDTFLRMRLPNGRELAYPFPRLKTTDRGDLVVIYKDNASGKWVDCRHGLGAYGGTWTENATQAAARDLLAAAMLRLGAAGYPIVLHVHDEIVAEVPAGIGSAEEFQRIVVALPEWAAGLLIAAKVDERERFCKIKPSADLPHEAHGPASEAIAAPADTCEPQDNTDNEADNTADRVESPNMRNYDGYPNGEERPRASVGPSYVYEDETGRPYLRVTRTVRGGKKIFPQQHWENGRWVWGKPPGPKIPYRLRELAATPLDVPVFVCEGERDADSVTALGLIATTNPGGGIPGAWSGDLNRWFAGRSVYILEDNDETGRAHANEVANNLRGAAAGLRIASFPELPEHGDVSDWINQGHAKEELLGRAKAGRIPDYRFKLVPFAEISRATTPAYLVKDLIPRVGLTVFWGPPKCGKSFFVLDLMMHVALGREYRGLKVRQSTVVYCALEGGEAFRNRVEAFRRKKLNGAADVPFYLMAAPLALAADQPALVASIRGQCQAPGAVVIDTLNRSLAGSESSDEDMSNYTKAADAIRDAFNCAVIIVHHCGHEGTRPRGHSSLTGNLDAQIAVARDVENNILVTVEYMKDGKDGPEGAKLASRLEAVGLGTDDDGDDISSCVVVPIARDETAPRAWDKKAKPPKGAAMIAHRALFDTIGDRGIIPPADPHIPIGRKCASLNDWRTQAYQMGISASPEAPAKRRAFERAIEVLVASNFVAMWGDFAWPICVV